MYFDIEGRKRPADNLPWDQRAKILQLKVKPIHTLGNDEELNKDCDMLSFTTIKIYSQTIISQ